MTALRVVHTRFDLEATALGVLDAENVDLVEPVHLLEEDEGQHGVRPEAEVVGGEALPQAEEALVPGHLDDDVDGALVLGLAVHDLHALDPRLGDVHRHRGDGGDQPGEHGGQEVAEDAVLDVV